MALTGIGLVVFLGVVTLVSAIATAWYTPFVARWDRERQQSFLEMFLRRVARLIARMLGLFTIAALAWMIVGTYLWTMNVCFNYRPASEWSWSARESFTIFHDDLLVQCRPDAQIRLHSWPQPGPASSAGDVEQ